MLQITIPASEMFDESTGEFINGKEITLQLEHSLVSISKWEPTWCRAFPSNKPKTYNETLDYIKCMTITQNVPEEAYNRLSPENVNEINKYIDAPMTATHFMDDKNGKRSSETTTSELIYYWMIALNIPFECQKWHLNRLLALIRVCNIKNQPAKKMGRNEIMSRNRALNAARRKQYNTRG